jgi:hypothetical protein
MKNSIKLCTLIAVYLAIGSSLTAKGAAGEGTNGHQAFHKGAFYLGGALGLGSGLGYLGGIALLANAEYGVTNNIGIGGSIGYWSYSEEQSYTYPFVGSYKVTYKYSVIPVVASGAWHFHVGIPKLDLAAGVSLGYYIVSATSEVSNSAISSSSIAAGSGSGLAWGVFGLARYFLTDHLALRAKLGYGITVAEVGVDFRF